MATKKRKNQEAVLAERMQVIDAACRAQGINTIEFVAQCIDAYRKGLPAPSLLPEDEATSRKVLAAVRDLEKGVQ